MDSKTSIHQGAAAAYLIVRLDNKGDVWDWGVYSSTSLTKVDKDKMLGKDIVVCSAQGASYAEASEKLEALIRDKIRKRLFCALLKN